MAAASGDGAIRVLEGEHAQLATDRWVLCSVPEFDILFSSDDRARLEREARTRYIAFYSILERSEATKRAPLNAPMGVWKLFCPTDEQAAEIFDRQRLRGKWICLGAKRDTYETCTPVEQGGGWAVLAISQTVDGAAIERSGLGRDADDVSIYCVRSPTFHRGPLTTIPATW